MTLHQKLVYYGGVLRDNLGNWLSDFSANFGVGSHILAELLAMEKRLSLESDCLEDVQIISERIQIRVAHILALVNSVRSWLAHPWVVTISFVCREANMVADFLAMQSSHSLVELKFWVFPPTDCQPLLLLDINLYA
ncbi:PREDICTED: uncharacterized protein LOC109350455 [Lupinus angustifolius]|uniref:uncharacterized protein LOC109350455 n=1 Tax=Lupinus angustifolius TaxID=3871 RepID=UPI00092FA4E8|nr:PREDICTED: uncharacterized protein LOC109350455 [Lupinus angustifolius]